MIMWKLEVNGDEITWRSTFGRKRTFHFEDITYCERKKGSMRVYVNGEKLFTIDSNIDKEEFMEDIKRRRNDNEPDNSMDGFQEIPTEEMEQLGLPEEWLKQK